MGCCAGGLLAALLWVRPLTLGTLTGGAATALAFPVGYATVGLVLSRRRPANPIGWLYAASGLAWALDLPFGPWLDQLVRDHWPLPLAALVSLVLRFRAARGIERQQLRWVAAGGAAALAGLLPTILVGLGIASRANDLVVYPAVLCVPVAVGVAVLRYRLWDLDRIISRTVTYTLVSGLLVLPYLLIVLAISRLAQDADGLGVAAATLAVAAAFSPVRRRVQDGVDRRFNRRRYDAARTIEAFAVRLRDQSTWTPSPPNCSPWWSRQSSRPAPHSGCATNEPTATAPGSHRQDHAGMVRGPSLLPGRAWLQRRLAGQGVSEGGLEPPRPMRALGPQPPKSRSLRLLRVYRCCSGRHRRRKWRIRRLEATQ